MFFLQITTLTIRKLTAKRNTLFVTNTQYKTPNSPSRSLRSVHQSSIMPERKGVKHSARAASIDSELEGLLHDDPLDVVRILSQNIRFVERSHENPTANQGI